MKYALAVGLPAILFLSSCSSVPFLPAGGDSGLSSSSISSAAAEDNGVEVSYEGVLEPLGVSIYMEGTHRLALGDGQYLILQSDVVNLKDYEGESVRVTGTVRPTTEGDAKIMHVTQAEVLLQDTTTGTGSSLSSDQSSVSSVSSYISSSSAEALASSVPASNSSKPVASSVVSSLQTSSVSSAALPSSTPSSFVSSSAASVAAGELSATALAQVSVMSKVTTEPAKWTQKYCSVTAGYCISVHKNWWYKSFGATPTSLWHVEISAAEIENVGDGPIQVNLVKGVLPQGVADGSLTESATTVTGFHDWTDGRHFEVTSPKELRASVQYILQNFSTNASSSSL